MTGAALGTGLVVGDYAFWKHDDPYVGLLGGVIEAVYPERRQVKVNGFGAYRFQPEFTLPPEQGELLLADLTETRAAGRRLADELRETMRKRADSFVVVARARAERAREEAADE